MTILPLVLILAGYGVLIATAGWWGVGIAVAHVGAMVLAACFSGSKAPNPRPDHEATTRRRARRGVDIA